MEGGKGIGTLWREGGKQRGRGNEGEGRGGQVGDGERRRSGFGRGRKKERSIGIINYEVYKFLFDFSTFEVLFYFVLFCPTCFGLVCFC